MTERERQQNDSLVNGQAGEEGDLIEDFAYQKRLQVKCRAPPPSALRLCQLGPPRRLRRVQGFWSCRV